jgi:hypothetical protein
LQSGELLPVKAGGAIFLDRRTSLRERTKGATFMQRTMSRPPQRTIKTEARPRRQRFADGSAVVTYRDGSVLILESALAKTSGLSEGSLVYSNEPPRQVSQRGKVAENRVQLPALKK